MANVATLTARLEADIRDFDRDMKTANRQVDNFEKNVAGASRGMGTFQKVLGGIGATIALQKLAVLGKEMTMLAVDAEEAGSAFKTTFGPAVDRAQRFVGEFANQAGFAEHELQQLLATTGNIIQGLGATEEVSVDLSESMARLAGDVASFSNAAGGAPAVLRALQSALTGEREALKTYGIVVSETEVVERALLDTHKSSAAELSKLDKAMATMAIATERAGKAVGDLDRTQDSAANTMRRFQAEVTEAKTRIGSQLVPVLSDLLEIAEDLIPAFEGIARTFVSGLKELKPYMAALGGLAKLMGKVSDETDGAEKELNWYQKTMKVVGGAITDSVMAPMRSLGDLLGFVTGATEETTAAIEDSTAVQQDAALKARALAMAQEDVAKAQNISSRSAENLAKRMGSLADTFSGKVREAVGNVVSAFEKLPDQIDISLAEFADQLEESFRAAQEWQLNLETAAAMGLDALAAGFLEAGPAYAQLLADAIASPELARALDAKFRALGALSTGALLQGVTDFGLSDLRQAERGLRAPLPKGIELKQHGGPVTAGSPYVVGERGPELFVPAASGSISPNGSFGGGSVTVHMQVVDDFRDPAAARRIIRDLARELEDYQRETIR